MVELLKLDAIAADGEAKVQRRVEVGDTFFLSKRYHDSYDFHVYGNLIHMS